jgi:hypothetical protein
MYSAFANVTPHTHSPATDGSNKMKQQVFTFTQLGHDHANLSSNYLLN